MLHQVIELDGLTDTKATLIAYVRDSLCFDQDKRRPAVVVCPGGGYRFCADREGEPIALALLNAGYQVFVLLYHVAPYVYPAALNDAALAVAHVRSHAERYHVAPDQIALMGFSAGGHLAGSLGVMWNRAALWHPLSLAPEAVRPNALVLCYAVLTAGEYAHRGSFEELTGSKDHAEHAHLSLETLVSKDTPPTFLWHTANDTAVPVQNSLLFAEALAKCQIPFELHIFPDGSHGLGLATPETTEHPSAHCAQWIMEAIAWLSEQMKGETTI